MEILAVVISVVGLMIAMLGMELIKDDRKDLLNMIKVLKEDVETKSREKSREV